MGLVLGSIDISTFSIPNIRKAPCCLTIRGLSNLGLIAKTLPKSSGLIMF